MKRLKRIFNLFLAVSLFTLFLSAGAKAESNDVGAFASRLVNEFPQTFISDANAAFSKPTNLAALLLAGGASIALHNTDADKNINDNLHHRAFEESTSDFFDLAGNPAIHLGATGIWYLYSQANREDLGRERAWIMLSALAVTDTVTFGLKAIVNNERPNGDNFSFPSAHTASSFCVASVLDEYYGPQVGLPAYIAASMVGWRMMDSGDHWASDVLFGGAVGYIVGHSVAGKHKQLELAGFKIEPMIDIGTHPSTGIALVKRF
jgi:membrane-associated phospholipid phosphatase